MPWLKSGDNAATYPKVMQIAGFTGVDPLTIVNETFGWLARCMLQCAGHTTDYHLDVGTAYMLGGPRTDVLVALCKRAKLLTEVRIGGIKMYRLISDPEFMHMRLKAEVDAERQRQQDNDNPALCVPVTLRDGDNCRYCGVLTQWMGRTSARTRTLDHRNGLGVPATVDTLVVACKRCNSARMLNPQWDDDHPLRPPPQRPQWGWKSAEYLTENGYPTQQNAGPERPAPAPGADPAPDGVRPATAAGDDTARPAKSAPKSTSKSLPRAIETTSPGSGRVGPGLGSSGSGSGGAGSGAPPPARRRGRRGARPSAARGEP